MDRPGNSCVDIGFRHGVCGRDGVGHHGAARQSQLPLEAQRLGDGCRTLQSIINLEAALAGVEGGQLFGLIADHRHPLRLQILQSQPDIEN